MGKKRKTFGLVDYTELLWIAHYLITSSTGERFYTCSFYPASFLSGMAKFYFVIHPRSTLDSFRVRALLLLCDIISVVDNNYYYYRKLYI